MFDFKDIPTHGEFLVDTESYISMRQRTWEEQSQIISFLANKLIEAVKNINILENSITEINKKLKLLEDGSISPGIKSLTLKG